MSEQLLVKHTQETFKKHLYEINDHILFFYSYGHSNATAIIGNSSVILIDTLDSNEYSQDLLNDLRKYTDKPVKTLIYTHGHPDHRGGAGTFRDTVEEVIAFTPSKTPLKYYEKIDEGLRKRETYQHGYTLTNEEAICQGIGIREGKVTGHGCYDFISPTTLYTEDKVIRDIDGIHLELYRAPGETDDQICIWMNDDQVLCTGDNYYAVFPALYAIRGTQYRDLATWIDSLDLILSFDANVLLPGHTHPLLNKELIQDQVGQFKEAIECILFNTLDCINKGLTLDETVQTVSLPEELKNSPYLQEYYGTVEWAVKSVYTGYVGWFDGDPVHLLPVSNQEYNSVLLDLIGEEKLLEKIKDCMSHSQYQIALQLLELIDNKELKKECLLQRAKQVKSANARHYLIACSKEYD